MNTEKREVPKWLERQVVLRGGTTLEGKPRFRVIWGGNRMRFADDGVTLIHPYQKDRWHLEKWQQELQDYEHCYVFAECPHRKQGEGWCNNCFLKGGEYIDATLPIIEARIGLIRRVEQMQQAGREKGARIDREQRDALFEREQKKEQEAMRKVEECVKDAAPLSVKRSFETPMRITAQEALGTDKFKQLN